MIVFNSEKLVKIPTSFKSKNPFCIDLILTNNREFFKESCTVGVGISDHHHLVETIVRIR